MKKILSAALGFSLLVVLMLFGQTAAPAFWSIALVPPMGWNSYDAFGSSVTEEEMLANAAYMKAKLLPHGYNVCVVDYRWSDADAASHNRNGNGGPLVMDEYGRLLPAPKRFPSAADGHGFKSFADKIHAMGFKLGIHVMRGIPRQAVARNTPIEGSDFHAAEAANTASHCGWCADMWGIDATKPAGQAYYDSIFRLYAAWEVDFVKVDDLSAPYSAAEVEAVRRAIDRCGRRMIFSTSPGETPVAKADHIQQNANMWRVSGDFWDRWSSLNHSFDLAAAWQQVGGPGHWPDFDMIPFGHVGIRCVDGESSPGDRRTRFTQDEQTTLMSLWCLAPSPLMLGGNLPDLDDWTLNLLTNDEALAIDQDPLGKPAQRVTKTGPGAEVWLRELRGQTRAAGLFNRGNSPVTVELDWATAGLVGRYAIRDVWQKSDLGVVEGKYSRVVPPHGAILIELRAVPSP